MREFKKWSKTEEGFTERGSIHEEQEVAWRAALEWILGQHCTGDWDDGSALETAIKQELGDT